MNRRKLVQEFYNFQSFEDQNITNYLDPEVSLLWNSSAGAHNLDYDGIINLVKEISTAFTSLRADVSHLLREKNMVTIRFTYYVKTMENPDEELPMAHFMAIWEIKDGKLYKGHQLSQTIN